MDEVPKKTRKRKEIVVVAPALRFEKDPLLKDTTGSEAFEVLKVCGKIGRHLSGLMIAVGVFLSVLSGISIQTPGKFPFSSHLFVGALGFLGAINIFYGLMLLSKK